MSPRPVSILLPAALAVFSHPGGAQEGRPSPVPAAVSPTQAVLRAFDPAEARALFRLADRDRNGWIAWREARFALGLDRAGFARFDGDEDGAVSNKEFANRCRSIVEAGGALPGPGPASRPAPAATRKPSPLPAWLAGLDPDGGGRIEIRRVLERLAPGSAESAASALRRHDRNGDGFLDPSELSELGLGVQTDPAGPSTRPSPPARGPSL